MCIRDSHYTVQSGDAGKTVIVTAAASGNYTGTVYSGEFHMARKVLSGTLSISGVAKVGETLTVEAALNGAVLNEDYTLCWYRDGEKLTCVSKDYTIVKEDEGTSLTVMATAIDREGAVYTCLLYTSSCRGSPCRVTAAAMHPRLHPSSSRHRSQP